MEPARSSSLRQWTVALVASLSIFIIGLSLGWPSPVLLRMKLTGEPMSLTSEELSWMVSLLYIGNLLSPMLSGFMMDKFGRKNTLLVLSLAPLLSWVIIYYASEPYHLHIARFLAGFWSGTASTVTPLYLAEISEAKIRGATSTMIQLQTNMGVLAAYVIGPVVSYKAFAFYCGLVPFIFVVLLSLMPESPYWLLMTGKQDKANKSLAWLRGVPLHSESLNKEMKDLKLAVKGAQESRKSYKDLFSSAGNRKALLIVEMLSLLQRMSGISALMAYSSTTLPERNVGILTTNGCVTVMGAVWFFSVFNALLLVDKLGRKPLLFISSVGCGFAMFGAGLWFFLNSNTSIDVQDFFWVPFASFIAYGVFFSFGLGPIASTVQGELFPANVRGRASGFTSLVLAATSFVMNKIYHWLARTYGMYINYWIFSGACVVSAVFVLTVVIETKGKSLYEIQLALGNSTKENENEENKANLVDSS